MARLCHRPQTLQPRPPLPLRLLVEGGSAELMLLPMRLLPRLPPLQRLELHLEGKSAGRLLLP